MYMYMHASPPVLFHHDFLLHFLLLIITGLTGRVCWKRSVLATAHTHTYEPTSGG